MEDGPEAADGIYQTGGREYRLEERESEVWSVFDGQTLLGHLIADPEPDKSGPRYTVRLAGDVAPAPDFVDEWQSALDYLIAEATA